ncbi:TetR/AcrR family transcriptional regulator [Nonomuraea sp. CA-141351]|uniref:TetR/AcrR family transcriptional regulator n=1 Tax=Nonomuraea sp. CA-141351 TaxID=3239996 RepID=UPI003D8E8FF2
MKDGLRARRKALLRQEIQAHAMRLFQERGYDETAVADIAQAVGVSSMTVFRHFPTKEDLVLSDEFDPALAARVQAKPADQPLLRRIGDTLVESLAQTPPAELDMLLARLKLGLATPALRARWLDNEYQTQKAIVDALNDGRYDEFHLQVVASACLAAATTALTRWAESGGQDMPHELLAQALGILQEES